MAFELDVAIGSLPDSLKQKWEEAYAACGIIVEIWPAFNPFNWNGGHLPMKLIDYPDQYLFGMPKVVQISGFELNISSNNAHFRSAMGRSMAELIMLCYGAATLANITNGAYHDLKTGKLFTNKDALERAHKEIMDYEPYIDDRARRQHKFTKWEDYQ